LLELVAEGRSNRAITAALYVTERTVEARIKQVFGKLGLREEPQSHSRVLAVLAYQRS
jgi:DNA-binding NarL/FixJ family response regulator